MVRAGGERPTFDIYGLVTDRSIVNVICGSLSKSLAQRGRVWCAEGGIAAVVSSSIFGGTAFRKTHRDAFFCGALRQRARRLRLGGVAGLEEGAFTPGALAIPMWCATARF